MIQEWLTQKITVEEAGAQHVVHDDRPGPDPVPSGSKTRSGLRSCDVWSLTMSCGSSTHHRRHGRIYVGEGGLLSFVTARSWLRSLP